MEYIGRVVIHYGECRTQKKCFSMFRFFIPYHRVTKLSLSELYENWSKSDSIEKAIDSLTGGLGDEFYLPNSTAYSYMSLLLIACRLNFEFLNISLPHELGLSTLRNLDQKTASILIIRL